MERLQHLQEDFVTVSAGMDRVEAVMTDRALMERWMSPAVVFSPLDGWRFDTGAPWRMQLRGLGSLLDAGYIVADRQPGLILWAFDGFWEGFDAWHWRSLDDGRTLIQNRIEYNLRVPGLDLIWPLTIGPLMGRDADVQMQRLKRVCEQL